MSQALKPSQVARVVTGYDSRFKLAALALLKANDNKLRPTARALNIPVQTLKDWRDGKVQNARMSELPTELKGDVGDLFERASRMYLDRSMDPLAIAATSGYYSILAASESIKTAQLMRGLPTSIAGSVISDDERNLRLAELLAKAQERKNTQE